MNKNKGQGLLPWPGRQSARSMTRDLRRWLHRRTPVLASPWAEWSRRARERYAGNVERGAPLAFVLLRRRGLIQTVRNRWLVRSQSLRPSIRLSVQAIFRAGGLTVFRADGPADGHSPAVQPLLIIERQRV